MMRVSRDSDGDRIDGWRFDKAWSTQPSIKCRASISSDWDVCAESKTSGSRELAGEVSRISSCASEAVFDLVSGGDFIAAEVWTDQYRHKDDPRGLASDGMARWVLYPISQSPIRGRVLAGNGTLLDAMTQAIDDMRDAAGTMTVNCAK